MLKTTLHILFLIPFIVSAQLDQQISFNQLSVDDGLSQNSVVSITQDREGYLWFATQDGLNKYDGKDFIYFPKFYEDITRENFSRLGKIYGSPHGTLYSISLEKGLETYSEVSKEFETINFSKTASTVLQDSDQNLWIGTYGSGLYIARKSQGDTLQVLEGVDALKDVYSLKEQDGAVHVAASNGLFLVDLKTLDYTRSDQNSEINFSSLEIDRDGRIWIGTYGDGLFYLNRDQELSRITDSEIGALLSTDLNIQCLLIDSKNRLWIGTYGDGAYLLDFKTNKIEHFTTRNYDPKAIHYNDVISIYEDFTGIVWMGTDGGGLSYYDENLSKFNSLLNSQIPEFANVDVARAITTDDENNLWIGTSGKGLTKMYKATGKYKSYKVESAPPLALPSNRVMSLMHDDGNIWIGYQDEGMGIVSGNQAMKHYNEESVPPLVAKTVWTLFKDRNKKMWLGTQNEGLILFHRSKGIEKHYKTENSDIATNEIRVITEDDNGALWLGTSSDGLIKYVPETEDFISFKDAGINQVKSLLYRAPYLWVGTNGNGLQRLNTKTEERIGFTTENGLPNNVIYGILPDSQNNLWLSSNRGITKFQYADSLEQPTITNYTVSDGLQAMEFNTGASYISNDGTLYFGGLNGVNWFLPENLSANKIAPRTVLKQMSLFNEPIPMVEDHTFHYKKNTLSFSFAALHFSQPDKNQYKYILENYETSWSKPSTINEAHYPNLPSGEYTFKVLSSNYEGIWDPTPASYSFSIASPWYWTVVAKILYLLLFGLLLFTIYSYLKWRWSMKMKLQLEHQETERLLKLDELKSKLYTNISHEFRTPLTLITTPVQQLISSAEIGQKDKKALEIIKGSSQRMLRLVNQLLDLSKLEKGAVELQVANHEMKPQLRQMIEAFTLNANERGIVIKDKIDEFDATWYDKDVFEKIVSNLLSNAIKYAPENSEVYFSVEKNKENAQIKCTNKNTSLSTKQISRLFDRFYQGDKNTDGVGVGLALIKELTLLSKGAISVSKEASNSITFLVDLPVNKKAYNENSIVIEKKKFDFPLQEAPIIFNSDSQDIPHLLIVEDNTEINSYIATLFSEMCKISTATNGLEGIQKAIKEVPDIVISDIMMPKKDGIELCNTLKTDQRTSHIPIFLLTAKSGDVNELSGLKNKADDYITKPFNAEILQQKVVNMIQSRRELRKRYSQSVFLAPKEIAITPVDELFLEEVQTVLDAHLTKPDFNAEGFANSMQLSRMQLHRKLKALTGLTSSEFLRSQRLKSALQLLKDSDLTINEVAYTVGFNTPSYFIRCFKEAYGSTPKEYIKRE